MTPEQKQAVEALAEYGSQRKAADALGITRSSLRCRLKYAELYEQSDPAVKGAMSGAGMQDAGVLHSGWIKTDEASLYFKMPVHEDSRDRLQEIRDAFTDMPAIEPLLTPPETCDADLLTVYPIPDAHIGMRAWGKETGEDYDTDIAVERIRSGIGQCVAAAPASKQAVIIALGDLLHSNDQSNMTPASKHVLDVDTRHYKSLEAAIYAMACAAETAAHKHDQVTVVIQRGNHDPTAYMAVMFALAERYKDNLRISVQKHPGEFFVMQHGKCLLASQHGDKAKAERLVMHLANQWPEMWGATRHRYYFTGHLHHSKVQDIGGVTVEQLRAVTARDAYASSHAYVAKAEMQSISYHAEHGEVSRYRVCF